MTPEDVAARAAAFAAAEDPLGLGHAAAAERWRELEAELVEAGAGRVEELPERARERWERRLNARSRVFSRPDAVPPEVAEPPGLPVDPVAREVRVTALGRTRDPAHVPALAAVLRSDDAPGVRAAAARGLDHIGGDEAVEALLQVTAPQSQIRKAIATSLGVLGDPRAVPRLIQWLDDEATMTEAAEALGHIGDPAAVPALAAQMTAKHWWQRDEARQALIAVGHPDAVEALRAQRSLLRPLHVRAARREVRWRQAPPPTRSHSWVLRKVAVAGKGLAFAFLIAWLPVVLLGADARVVPVALISGGLVFLLMLSTDRRERHRDLDRARCAAAREPRMAGRTAALLTVGRVLLARPAYWFGHLAAALVLEWATGRSGVAAGLLAGLLAAAGLERLVQARLIAGWQRTSGERLLLSGRRRFFFARRDV